MTSQINTRGWSRGTAEAASSGAQQIENLEPGWGGGRGQDDQTKQHGKLTQGRQKTGVPQKPEGGEGRHGKELEKKADKRPSQGHHSTIATVQGKGRRASKQNSNDAGWPVGTSRGCRSREGSGGSK